MTVATSGVTVDQGNVVYKADTSCQSSSASNAELNENAGPSWYRARPRYRDA